MDNTVRSQNEQIPNEPVTEDRSSFIVHRSSFDFAPDRTDYIIAFAIAIGTLVIYTRTLAPDVLYGDSAEFQTLAYTLGTTHSTGYPIYLLLARLLGFLPLGSLAWRVNLLSTLGATVTVCFVFLLIRCLTPSRIGSFLGSLAFGLSYTFWSQAIIAEVYTPALAFLSLIMFLLWRWQHAAVGPNRLLLFAALLASLGLGVHASVVLIIPVVIIFVIWVSLSRLKAWPQRGRALLAALAGLLLGGIGFLLAFFAIDLNNPPSSFIQVALYPSRSIWGLEVTDLDSTIERMWLTVTGLQWQDAMFPADNNFVEELGIYYDRLIDLEFSPIMLLCALLGVAAMLYAVPKLGLFWLAAFASILFFILNYRPPDKYIFYLPANLLVAIGIGAGAGFLLGWARRSLEMLPKRLYNMPLYLLAAAFLPMVIQPVAASRWRALQSGAATFVQEDYVYPRRNLAEPRRNTTAQLNTLPDNALLIMGWRTLYTIYYLAHVEQLKPDIRAMEAAPHGGDGQVADTLIQTMKDALAEGRPVFADRPYSNLRRHFNMQPALGGEWYRLSLPETD